MEITSFFAQFWGWLMIIAAAIYLVGGDNFFHELLRMHKEKDFIFLSGWILLLMGLATIIVHGPWFTDWKAVIAIAGWASLLKGITRIGFPEFTQKMISACFKKRVMYFRIAMVAVGLLGAWMVLMA